MNVKRLHCCTPSAVPSSDRPYPLIFLIPYINRGKSGDKCERSRFFRLVLYSTLWCKNSFHLIWKKQQRSQPSGYRELALSV